MDIKKAFEFKHLFDNANCKRIGKCATEKP